MSQPKGVARVRLADVAELAGVSMKTVSNVVHDYAHVSPKVRERVQAAIDELGYRPNITARHLATGKTGMIALAIPEIDQPYFAEIARHISTEAGRRGYRVIVEQTLGSIDAERAVIRDRDEGLVDGVIFHPVRIGTLEIAQLKPGTPLVVLGEAARPLSVDHVMIDNVAAARAGVETLIARGRRRILFLAVVAQELTDSTHLRLLGYQEALIHAGIPVRPELVLETSGFEMAEVAQALSAAIASGLEFDAVVCRDDLFAVTAIRTLVKAGRVVPDDVAVLGWDDTFLAEYALPAISSISPDKSAIATQALTLLTERIRGHAGIGRHVLTPYRVVERETT